MILLEYAFILNEFITTVNVFCLNYQTIVSHNFFTKEFTFALYMASGASKIGHCNNLATYRFKIVDETDSKGEKIKKKKIQIQIATIIQKKFCARIEILFSAFYRL